MKKEKIIFDKFSEKFPLLQRLYSLYEETGNMDLANPDNTIRKSTEIIILEILEMVVIASSQSKADKRKTLEQVKRKIDCINVFFGMVKDLRNVQFERADELLEEISRMIGGWSKALKDPEDEV